MLIKDLHLHQYRNYKDHRIEFQPGMNLLVGPNGQGKTNVLEGIQYLLTGKSHRAKNDKELILWGEKYFYLQGSFIVKERKVKLESYHELNRKVMKINQIACRRLSDYVGTVNAVFFSPDDLDIIKKSPAERRRFLDLLIYQVKPLHISLINTYLRIIRQKNNLLKTEKKISELKNQLHVWNEQLVEIGTQIIINRADMTEKLNKYCRPIFKRIFSHEYLMDLRYLALGNKDKDEVLSLFPQMLEKKMDQEIERKMVLTGPHRDDIQIDINQKDARLYASQGQQRAIILCLKLAEMEIILNEKEDYPILLLDDVLSELDEQRREYLINDIYTKKKQTIITMTEADQKLVLPDTAVFKVFQGNIRREH